MSSFPARWASRRRWLKSTACCSFPPQPLNQDDLIQRINLSKGSASQGLRYLLDLGAVRTVYQPGDRRVHYEAVAALRNLASGPPDSWVSPRFLGG